MDITNGLADSRTQSGPPLRPKGVGFVKNVVNGINRLEQRATGNRRKKFEAKQLPPGKDIFHGYEFPQAPQAPTKTAGRKPYNWTPKRSRELIKLIIHTDLKFDDISTAMKDKDGTGPSETTCRNHWHEIFGYSPDMARLKYGQGRERRLREHLEAFDAHQKKVKTLEASTVKAELQHGARAASKASSTLERSRTSSIYADSGVQVDDDGAKIKQRDSDTTTTFQDGDYIAPDLVNVHAVGSDSVINSSVTDGYSLRPGVLSTVEEDSEAPDHVARPVSPNTAPSELSPEDLQDRKAAKAPVKTVAHIEEKEDLPSGFIHWFRKISLGSITESRHPSTASYASRTSLRFSRSVRNSVVTSISMGYHQERVPKDAICKYLGNNNALVEPSVGYVEELISRGADVNAKNERGETPLHFAVGRGAIVICTILLQHGADAEAKSYAGESVWEFGRRISKRTLDPQGSYDKTEQLLRTMVAARIEFLRATIKFNPDMVVEEPDRAKRRRTSDQLNAWSRSGAAGGASSGRKKTRVTPPLPSPKPVRSPSVTQPTPESLSDTTGDKPFSGTPTVQPPVAAGPSQWQQPVQTNYTTDSFPGPSNEASYFPDPSTYPVYSNDNTQTDSSFSTGLIDPLYTGLPSGFFEGQEFMIDYSPGMAMALAGESAILPHNQGVPYVTEDSSNLQQRYSEPILPTQRQFAQGNSSMQQEYGQPSLASQQSYSQSDPPIQQQHYGQPTRPTQRPHAQSSPAMQQYSQASPHGTISPQELSMSSPGHFSASASPGQYLGDYSGQPEGGNSNASNIDPVVVPNYPPSMNEAIYAANTTDRRDFQGYATQVYPAATDFAPARPPNDLLAQFLQEQQQQQQAQSQSQEWRNGGYSQ